MSIKIKGILKNLFPAGDAIEEDQEALSLLSTIEEEFQHALKKISMSISSSRPCSSSVFFDRWKKITSNGDPEKFMKIRVKLGGYEDRGYTISNSKNHFKSIAGDVEVECKSGVIRFKGSHSKPTYFETGTRINKAIVSFTHYQHLGIKNIATRTRAGKPIGNHIVSYVRDEETIQNIESIKHAHLISKYEVTQNA